MPTAASPSAAIHLEVTPEKAALLTNKTTLVRALVRIQAPQLSPDSVVRRPLHLALVLDRSGSMNGVPLDEAKRCARNIVDSLAAGDRAAIYAFDDEIMCGTPYAGIRQIALERSALHYPVRWFHQPAWRVALGRR